MLRLLKPTRATLNHIAKYSTKNWPISPYDEYPNSYLTAIASATDDEIDQMLGPKVLRATQVEAAVRMLADYFSVYDTMDKAFLEEKLKREFEDQWRGVSSTSLEPTKASLPSTLSSSYLPTPLHPSIQINHSLINQMTDEELVEAHRYALNQYSPSNIKDININDYLEMTAYNTPKYTASNSKKIYTDLFVALNRFEPGFFKGVGNKLLSSDGVPNIKEFHLIIRQLIIHQYARPAELALDCLYFSDIPLTLETFSLAIKLAILRGDLSKFMSFVSCIQVGVEVEKDKSKEMAKIVEKMSSRKSKIVKLSDSPPSPIFNRIMHIPSTSDELPPYYTAVLTNIAEGFCKFGLYRHINVIILEMIRLKVLNEMVLSFNLRIADIDKDSVRARWTINEMITNDSLSYVKDEFYIQKAKELSIIKDNKILREKLKSFNDQLPLKRNIP